MSRCLLLGFAGLTLVACGESTAIPPRAAGAFGQEQAAKQAERDAEGYETAEAQAAGPHGSQPDSPNTFDNRRAAIGRREQAAEHRALAQELRAAELEACAGVPEEQPDPFLRRDNVAFVSIIEERGVSALVPDDALRTIGVRLRLRGVPGTTTQSLQELIDCHLAHARASGTATTLGDGSPLTLDGVVAKVGWMADGFAVSLTADDRYAVQELVRWAQAFRPAE